MKTSDKVVVILGVLFGLSRVLIGVVSPHFVETFLGNCYKDAAHFYMGSLFALWYVQRKWWQMPLFIALSVLKTIVAILTRL